MSHKVQQFVWFTSVMESRHSFMRISASKVLVSVSKATSLETFNIATKWLIQISIIQPFFVCYTCR